ncbi:MAG: sulfatase [Armatimonadetes bacterium]|nr:sulfatase [Armatimonadota bacterium]
MNILLLTIDSLRADHLGCYGYSRPTTPNLDSWAADAVAVDRFYCPGVPTTPVFTSLLTGQLPLNHGIVSHRGGMSPRAGYPWLPALLQHACYTTTAVDNIKRLLPWFTDGFEYYIDPSHRHGHIWSASTQTLNQRTIPWLRGHAGKEPFFLFVHGWDAHTPYLPPMDVRHAFYPGDPCDPACDSMRMFRRQYFHVRSADWLKQLCDDLGKPGPITDVDYLVALYDACLLHMDRHVADLLSVLDESGVADDTLVLFLGDHGEMMGEHDIYFDHHGLYEGNINPPLLARWPNGGIAGGRRMGQLAQHQDLAATILSAAGQAIPERMDGFDLLPLLRGENNQPVREWLTSEECTWQAAWAIRDATHKLILARGPSLHNQPGAELYDLVNDPGETTNLYLTEYEVAEALERRLEGWIAERVAALGIEGDPVRHENISLGRRWFEWLEGRKG